MMRQTHQVLGRQEKGLRRREQDLRLRGADRGRHDEVPGRYVQDVVHSVGAGDLSVAFRGREEQAIVESGAVLVDEGEDLRSSSQDLDHPDHAMSLHGDALDDDDQVRVLIASLLMRRGEDRRRRDPIVAHSAQARAREPRTLVESAEAVTQTTEDPAPTAEDQRLEEEARSKKTQSR